MSDTERPFARLSPETVLDAVEAMGLVADGRLMALNSYENRVYRVGVDPSSLSLRDPRALADAVVAKFYRPSRWSESEISEEHAFARELAAAELPVAAPLAFDGQTLHEAAGYRFTLFECWPGGSPDLDLPDHRAMLGRLLGRMHRIGARHGYRDRATIGSWRGGARAREPLLQGGLIPEPLDARYAEAAAALVRAIESRASALDQARWLRVHGDCHAGNILWNATGPLFVDFDDSLMAPAVQDLWMFCAGTPA